MMTSAISRPERSPSVIERRPVFGVAFVPSAPMNDATLRTPRLLAHDVRDLLLELHHLRERDVRGRLRHGRDEAGVLVREEAFGTHTARKPVNTTWRW